MPAITTSVTWTPLDEGRPQEFGRFLIALTTGETGAAYYRPDWQEWLGTDGQQVPDLIITHWTPIPNVSD